MWRSSKQSDGSGIGIRPIDTESSQRKTEAKGKGDGSRRFPQTTSTGDKVADYEGLGQQAEAKTTETLLYADHLGNKRTGYDINLGNGRSVTNRCTARTTNAREKLEDASAERRGFEQSMPVAGKARFLSPRTVMIVLAGLAVGSAAAIIAALQGATEDREYLTYLIGGSVALAGVVIGLALGVQLRRRDLDALKGGNYAAHTYRWILLLLAGIVGALALGRGVASLREASSEADAARRARQTDIEVFIPGQQAQPNQPAPEPSGSVPWTTWFCFEFGLIVAAVLVEYHRADARVEWGERLRREEKQAEEEWRAEHSTLQTAVGVHEGLMMTRADIDAAVALTGQAHHQWADRLSATYRYGNNSARAEGGDPFGEPSPAGVTAFVTLLQDIPGTDLPVMTPISEASTASTPVSFRGEPDWSNREQIDVILLSRAHDELSKAPERPERDKTEPWVPARDLAADAQVIALDAAFAKRQAEHAKARKDIAKDTTDLDFKDLPEYAGNGNNRSES
jgi:hypothetical protein